MRLQPGDRLGPYEIVSALGAGGMGEVYRARDPRLGRDVAIKVLPAAFSADADRLHRFEQEARAAAALNHPNILAVYDIGTDGRCAVHRVGAARRADAARPAAAAARSRLARRSSYAVAIARGLAAAHDKGIIHRDLKPENVFITPDDRIKILDFGLAKLTQDRPRSATASALAHDAVADRARRGARHRRVHGARAGPWTGRRSSRGSVRLRRDPVRAPVGPPRVSPRHGAGDDGGDPQRGSAGSRVAAERPIPPALARIVDRCLEKSPSARFQTASDLAFALEALSDASSASRPRRADAPRRARPRRVARLGRRGVAAGDAGAVRVPARSRAARRARTRCASRFRRPSNWRAREISACLRTAVTWRSSGVGSDGIARLWIRAMDSLEVRPLPGSETVGIDASPVLVSRQPVHRVRCRRQAQEAGCVGRSAANLVRSAWSVAVGGSWNRDGDIIVGNIAGGVLRVRETGGAASPVTALDPSRKEEFHLLPSFLPDGRHFVYLRIVAERA